MPDRPPLTGNRALKTCPRCGARFPCQASSVAACQCAQVPLDEDLTARLAATWDDCLCARCLWELADRTPAPAGPAAR